MYIKKHNVVACSPRVCHAQKPRVCMLDVEILVVERVAAEYTGASSSVTVDEITALDHKVGNLCRG